MINVDNLSRNELMELMSGAARRLNEVSYSTGYKDGFNDGMRACQQKSALEKSIPEDASKQDDYMISFNSVLNVLHDHERGGYKLPSEIYEMLYDLIKK